MAVEYTFTTENQPKKDEAKDAPVNPSAPEPSAPSESKDQAKDQSKAPADSEALGTGEGQQRFEDLRFFVAEHLFF